MDLCNILLITTKQEALYNVKNIKLILLKKINKYLYIRYRILNIRFCIIELNMKSTVIYYMFVEYIIFKKYSRK